VLHPAYERDSRLGTGLTVAREIGLYHLATSPVSDRERRVWRIVSGDTKPPLCSGISKS